MKSYNSDRKKKGQRASVIAAIILCLISMFSIAAIYKNAVAKQEKAKSLLETKDLTQADETEMENNISSARNIIPEDNIENETEDDRIINEIRNTDEALVPETTTQEPEGQMVSSNQFTRESILTWPVQGEVLMEYSMEQPTYYRTLEQYGYSTGMVIQAERGTPVHASSDGIITAVEYTDEYGWSVRMDIGSGYEVVYGQLTGINVSEGDNVVIGSEIAEVSAPSKNYLIEGDNLYFELKQNGEAIDPIEYLE